MNQMQMPPWATTAIISLIASAMVANALTMYDLISRDFTTDLEVPNMTKYNVIPMIFDPGANRILQPNLWGFTTTTKVNIPISGIGERSAEYIGDLNLNFPQMSSPATPLSKDELDKAVSHMFPGSIVCPNVQGSKRLICYAALGDKGYRLHTDTGTDKEFLLMLQLNTESTYFIDPVVLSGFLFALELLLLGFNQLNWLITISNIIDDSLIVVLRASLRTMFDQI